MYISELKQDFFSNEVYFQRFYIKGRALGLAKLSLLSVVTLICTIICHTFERRKTKQKICTAN